MLERLPAVPSAYCGLWERTLLQRGGPGTLTGDRPARVFWMQTPLWHADIRIPLERPDFAGVASLEACSDDQLGFIAGQEGFCGLTRVDGVVCTWLRLFDLNPGSALDIGRMRFETPELLIETGIAEPYLEHWSLVACSRPRQGEPAPAGRRDGPIVLTSGNWAFAVSQRPPAPAGLDVYAPPQARDRTHLLWRASLLLTLLERDAGAWVARLSTWPWIEGTRIADAALDAAQAFVTSRTEAATA